MNGSCAFADDMGVVRNMLAAVDCNTRDFAMLGYQSLTGNHSFQLALTALLTIYVALIGYRLLFAPDGMRLSDGPGMALKVGATIALVTSWGLFQTLVFDMASRAPLEIAGLVAAPIQDNSTLAADPVGGMQVAYEQFSAAAALLGKAAGTSGSVYANNDAQASELLTVAANVIFLGCAGLVAVVMIAIGVLTSIGPVFVALMLFFETRGIFAGWIRALSGTAIALLSSWMLIVLMLHVLEPWLTQLAERGDMAPLDQHAATTAAAIVFVFSACQFGMIIVGFVVAAGFSLASGHRTSISSRSSSVVIRDLSALTTLSRPARLAELMGRSGASVPMARVIPPAAPFGSSFESRTTQLRTRDEPFYRRPFVTAAAGTDAAESP